MSKSIVDHALEALLYEVVTEPKPGLVDPNNNGSHSDMDVYTFINSSVALREYFEQASQLGESFTGNDLIEMFASLREKGIQAEKAMFAATNNVNTHKGAIFSLGIFTCAQSYAGVHQQNVYEVIRQMCKGLVAHDMKDKEKTNKTIGEQIYFKYGYAGARELAESGYPVVEKTTLPFLEKSTGTINQRLLDTLIKTASVIADTTFIKRSGGMDQLPWLKKVCQQYFDLGGSKTAEGIEYLREMNTIFVEHNYTLGGCADILIVTIFMALEKDSLSFKN